MCQQHPQFLTAYRLHMHRTVKPCAMPRASLRSVLLICAFNTACMCRVSTQITGNPERSCEPHLKAEHMAAPTNAANVKKALANSEPSTHGTKRTCQIRTIMSPWRG